MVVPPIQQQRTPHARPGHTSPAHKSGKFPHPPKKSNLSTSSNSTDSSSKKSSMSDLSSMFSQANSSPQANQQFEEYERGMAAKIQQDMHHQKELHDTVQRSVEERDRSFTNSVSALANSEHSSLSDIAMINRR